MNESLPSMPDEVSLSVSSTTPPASNLSAPSPPATPPPSIKSAIISEKSQVFVPYRRKKRVMEPENHERWLVSYADFITLLFAFFVVMYAVSSVNEGKYRAVANSLDAAFHEPPRSAQPIQLGEIIPVPQNHKQSIPGAQLSSAQVSEEISQEINKTLGDLIKKDILKLRQQKMWLEVEIKTSILFPSGSAVLEPSALPALSEIASILKNFPHPIQIAGFTDDRPISSVLYRSNWELSAARAASVVHLFNKLGVKPERMSAVGYGEYRPTADNATPEGRNKNRRVVLQILTNPKGMPEFEPVN